MALLKRVFNLGTDAHAVSHRIMMLELAQSITGSLTPWVHDGKLDDAVITVAARFPLKWMQLGHAYPDLPFETEKSLTRVESQSGK